MVLNEQFSRVATTWSLGLFLQMPVTSACFGKLRVGTGCSLEQTFRCPEKVVHVQNADVLIYQGSVSTSCTLCSDVSHMLGAVGNRGYYLLYF